MKKIILIGMAIPYFIIAKPVKIDEILTQSGDFKLDTTISYSNIQRANGTTVKQVYQTNTGDFVSIPTYAGESKSNQDYFNYDMTLRYGATKDLELFLSANMYHAKSHVSALDTFDTQNSKGFNALNIGMTYQIKKEDETPSLLLGLSTGAYTKTKFENKTYDHHFKNYRFFATSFYTVDPVVFMVNASYGANLEKSLDTHTKKDAGIMSVSPQVYFAVNPYTSLSAGVKYTYIGISKLDKKQVTQANSNLSLLVGMSYDFSSKMFLNVNAEFLNNSASTQNTISTTLSYKF